MLAPLGVSSPPSLLVMGAGVLLFVIATGAEVLEMLGLEVDGVTVAPAGLPMGAGVFFVIATGAVVPDEVGLGVNSSEMGRSAHIPSSLQYPSSPSQVFAHFAILQVESSSPSHSSNGSTLDAE